MITNKMNKKLVMNWYIRNASTVDLVFLRNSPAKMEINGKIKSTIMEFLDSKSPLMMFH